MSGFANIQLALGAQAPPVFPFLFLSVAETGEVASSNDGAVWAGQGTLPVTLNRLWKAGAISSAARAYVVGNNIASANTIELAYSDTGLAGSWTQKSGVATGMNGFVTGLIWTDLFSTSRLYALVHSNGANQGSIWYSDDEGSNWTSVTWAGAPALVNPYSFALGTDRLLCVGNFAGDGASVLRVFYTLNGTAMLAGVTGLTNLGFNTSDVEQRSLIYSPTLNLFAYIGGSGSAFFAPAVFTTANGAAASAIAATPFANNSNSGSGVWMSNVSRFVTPAIGAGVIPHQAFIYGTTGLAYTAVAEGSPDPNGVVYHMVYNGGRAVGGQGTTGGAPGGFVYTDDGVTYHNVAAPSVKKWRAMLARL